MTYLERMNRIKNMKLGDMSGEETVAAVTMTLLVCIATDQQFAAAVDMLESLVAEEYNPN